MLARDDDERVRALLARKLAGLAPALSGAEQSRLQHEAYDTLICLVEDEAVRVRAAIAEVIKQMPDVPRGLILRLARDAAVPVSEPVIRLSPLLTTADLLALVNTPPAAATAVAVARRATSMPGSPTRSPPVRTMKRFARCSAIRRRRSARRHWMR